MKTFRALLLFAAMISFGLVSCTQNELESDIPFEKTNSQSEDKIEFIYDGVKYVSECYYSNDSMLIIKDENVNFLFQKLSNLPELASYVHEDGTLELFTNSISAQEKIQTKNSSKLKATFVTTSITGGTFHICDRINMDTGGPNNHTELSTGGIEIPDLGSYPTHLYAGESRVGHDVLSSFRMICKGVYYSPPYYPPINYKTQCTITLFEHAGFQGRSIVFSISGINSLQINDLRNYVYSSGGLFSKTQTWNDRISSIKVSFS